MVTSPRNAREVGFDWRSVTVVAVTGRTVSNSNDYIDITSDDDAGWRTLLPTPGVRQSEITLTLVADNEKMLLAMFDFTGGVMVTTIPLSGVAELTLTGTFQVTNVEYVGDSGDALTVNATFQSSGPVTVG